jgi:hypothetical protein
MEKLVKERFGLVFSIVIGALAIIVVIIIDFTRRRRLKSRQKPIIT